MELNVKDKTLKYVIGDIYEGIIFENIKLKNQTYNLAVTLGEDGDCLELTNFEMNHI